MLKQLLNKSLLTNVLAIVVIGFGILLNEEHLRTTGYYALSGAFTNWIAIYMLFEEVPFLYGSGVIPKHFEAFKEGIRNLIMEEFFTLDNIERLLLGDDLMSPTASLDSADLIRIIDFDRVFNGLVETILASSFGGMVNMLGGANALEALRAPFLEKLKHALNDVLGDPQLVRVIKQKLFDKHQHDFHQHIAAILQKRLNELTPAMVKRIIQDMIQKHLGWLVVWGGVFGALLGLIVSFLG